MQYLHFEKFGKCRKFDKNTFFFIREIAANFNNFQGSSTSAQKLLYIDLMLHMHLPVTQSFKRSC